MSSRGWLVLRDNRNLNRNRAAGSGATAFVAGRPARAGASPASVIAVGPARAHAGDTARAVAARASGLPARTHHRVLIHDLLDNSRTGENAEAGG